MKKALITGITGQDGSYLLELLLDKGYEVHGIIRRSSSFNTGRIDHLYNNPEIQGKRMFLHYGDVTDTSNLNRLLEKIEPDEIYNLAAQSHVKVSFEIPEYTAEVDAIGTLRFLDAIRETGVRTRFYQASTSELFGKVQEIPQTEKTPFYPRSPYGVAKLTDSGLLSITGKRTDSTPAMGSIQSRVAAQGRDIRDAQNYACGSAHQIGFAGQTNSRELAFKTGLGLLHRNTVRDVAYVAAGKTGRFCVCNGGDAFRKRIYRCCVHELDMELVWKGEKENEVGLLKKDGRDIVAVDPRYYRPTEVDC